MKSKAYTLHLLIFLSLVKFSSFSYAQETVIDPNKMKTTVKEVGKVLAFEFNDGRKIQFKLRKIFMPFTTTATLADNSCTKTINLKANFFVPVVLRVFIPYWASHPTKAGQGVTKLNTQDNKVKVNSQTAFYGRDSAAFNKLILDSHLEVLNKAQFKETIDHVESLGWLECTSDCKDVLPHTTNILYWDQNFENSNAQLSMVPSTSNTRINQITSRLQDMAIRQEDRKLLFAPPKKVFGFFSKLFPPGITYQIQWNFQAPNLVNTDDSLCQMSWDLDFTQIFTQFTKLTLLNSDPNLLKIESLEDYTFQNEDEENIFLGYYLKAQSWESSGIEK